MDPHNDHDILIVVSTKLDMLAISMEAIRVGMLAKADVTVVADHEKRLRATEIWQWKVAGALLVIQFVLHSAGFYVITHLRP
jgi:hypothetical protein